MTTIDLRKQVLDPREEKLLDEVELRNNGRPHRRHIANLFDRIFIWDLDDRQHYLLHTVDGNFKFEKVTQTFIFYLSCHTCTHLHMRHAPIHFPKMWHESSKVCLTQYTI